MPKRKSLKSSEDDKEYSSHPKLCRTGVASFPNDIESCNAENYKRRIGKSKHITRELYEYFESSQWIPSVPIKNYIFRTSVESGSKPTKLQNMWDFISAMTEECGLESPLYLCYLRGITIGTNVEKINILKKYIYTENSKIYNTKKLNRIRPWKNMDKGNELSMKLKQYEKISCSMESLMKFSTDYFKEVSKDKVNRYSTGFPIEWLDKNKLAKQCHKYFGMFHVIVVIFNYIFSFIDDSFDKGHGNLIKYARSATEHINSYTQFWSNMESCVRLFYNQLSHRSKDIIDMKPYNKAISFFDSVDKKLEKKVSLSVEILRDELVESYMYLFSIKSSTDQNPLVPTICDKDMTIVGCHILQECYTGRVLYLNDQYNTFMMSKKNDAETVLEEENRHRRLAIMLPKYRSIGNHLIVINKRKSIDDDTIVVKKRGIIAKDEFDFYNLDSWSLFDFSTTEELHPFFNIDNESCMKVIKMQRASIEDMKTIQPVFVVRNPKNNKIRHMEFSSLDYYWDKLLLHTHHVSPKRLIVNDDALLKDQIDGRTFIWCTLENSDETFEFGVLRGDDYKYRHKFTLMNNLNFIGISNLCIMKGKNDKTRHNSSATTFSIDVGLGDHNFDYKHLNDGNYQPINCMPNRFNNIDIIVKSSVHHDIAKLLDIFQKIIDEYYIDICGNAQLNNVEENRIFGYAIRDKLGCKIFRFHGFTMTFSVMDINDKTESNTTNHRDNLNGRLDHNRLSVMFSMYVRVEVEKIIRGEKKKCYAIGRINFILWTRRVAEDFIKKEGRLVDLKDKIDDFKLKVNADYIQKLHTHDNVRFENPEKIRLTNEMNFDYMYKRNNQGLNVNTIRVRSGYAFELTMSAGISCIREFYLRTKSIRFAIEFILFSVYLRSYVNLYCTYSEICDRIPLQAGFTVFIAKEMNSKTGGWRKGEGQRSRPPREDYILLYSNINILNEAVDSIQDFLMDMEGDDDMSLFKFQVAVKRMIANIPGLDELYGQRIPLIAALSGVILLTNTHHATKAYPTQKNIIGRFKKDWDLSMGVKAQEFEDTAELLCHYACIPLRLNFAENISCDGISRTHVAFDYFIKGQSLFWLFYENKCYVPKELKFNQTIWKKIKAA